ncbi:MAG: sigma-54 dependent transcriptional regulator [Bacteroidota bacterium]
MDIQSIKLRFEIIGNSPELNRAIDIARQVASTDLSVLITGESGTGKEVFPKIIHNLSSRKHGTYIAVNCGAIPEGTIDSELFGHEKGSFTGAHEARKGYFEVANGGTIFLDEVAELPLQTQVRLLRVLETGEFMKVGSSKMIKTDVRITAATNINLLDAINKGKFREDLYYRLNTVPITMPALRTRNEDILMLFAKFSSDFAEKYRMPSLTLNEDAQRVFLNYRWPGNVRQLKNVTEQASVIEKDRILNAASAAKYLHTDTENFLPVLMQKDKYNPEMSERDILYKVLFDMKNDLTELKKIVFNLIDNPNQLFDKDIEKETTALVAKKDINLNPLYINYDKINVDTNKYETDYINNHEEIEESLSLQEKEIDMIKKSLHKHTGKRKNAAKELGISERTLYRKIKEFNIK